jgi:MSHA pilin protein MshC
MNACMRGFTMLELILVISVLGVLTALAAPRLVDNNALQERGAQAQLRGMLVHARQLAIAQQREVCAQLTPTRVRLVYVVAGQCSAGTPVNAPAGNCATPGVGCPFEVMAPSRSSFSGPDLRFNPRGQPVPNQTQFISVGSLSLSVQAETGMPL